MGRGTRRITLLITFVALAASAAPASAAPSLGRWEARGPGGARIVFMVIGAGPQRYVAHVVSFCGSLGEPELDDWSYPTVVYDTGVARLRGDGRFATSEVGGEKTLAGRLGERRGSVNAHPYELLALHPGTSCGGSAYKDLRVRHVGPAERFDGLWRIVGTLGTAGDMRVYGGGTLYQWSGTFVGSPPPKYPEVPCRPVAFRSSVAVRGRGGISSTFADNLGGITGVTIRGAFFSPRYAAGVYNSLFNYFDYTCLGLGAWAAELVRRPRYNLTLDRPGSPPAGHVRAPVRTGPRPPRSGREPNTFRCPYRLTDPPTTPDPAYHACRIYTRRDGGTTQLITLRYGAQGWGYHHIAAKRGFSAKTDRYIAQTLARGRPDPDDRVAFVRSFRGHGRSCRYRVVTGAPEKGIITAYRQEKRRQGNVSGCP